MSKYVSKQNLNTIVQEMGKKIPSILNLTNEELQEIIDAFEPEFTPEDEDNADRSLSNLTDAGKDRFLGADNFKIIYPNGGTEANPANVAVNSRYVEANPFPGYAVHCQAEVLFSGQWGTAEWKNFYTSAANNYTGGVKATQLDDDSIIIQTAGSETATSYINLVSNGATCGGPFTTTSAGGAALPCRVKVWKIGKVGGNA